MEEPTTVHSTGVIEKAYRQRPEKLATACVPGTGRRKKGADALGLRPALP